MKSCFETTFCQKVVLKLPFQNVRKKYHGISIGKNKEYKKDKIFYMDVLKTIHKKISNQKMKSKERDKSILQYVQCMYNNVHTYEVPGF